MCSRTPFLRWSRRLQPNELRGWTMWRWSERPDITRVARPFPIPMSRSIDLRQTVCPSNESQRVLRVAGAWGESVSESTSWSGTTSDDEDVGHGDGDLRIELGGGDVNRGLFVAAACACCVQHSSSEVWQYPPASAFTDWGGAPRPALGRGSAGVPGGRSRFRNTLSASACWRWWNLRRSCASSAARSRKPITHDALQSKQPNPRSAHDWSKATTDWLCCLSGMSQNGYGHARVPCARCTHNQ
eukprot:11164259-Lingulodinium_polyedra.AAC.3